MNKNYLTLAEEAIRERKFDDALEYYEKQLETNGLSVHLLRAVGKLCYLNGQSAASLQYYIAAIHLSLYINNEAYKKGDEKVIKLLEEIPEKHKNQFKERIGDILLYESHPQKHIGHSYFDQETFFEKQPELRKYADVYYAGLLDDGSASEKFAEHNITEADLTDREIKLYIPMGFSLIDKYVKWSEISNPDVYQLYELV